MRCATIVSMTAKEALLGIVQGLTEEEAEGLIDLLNLHADPDELTAEELAAIQESQAQGGQVLWDDLKLELGL